MNTYTGMVRLCTKPKMLGGGKVIVFSVADNVGEKVSGEYKKDTLFINCSVFGQMKEYCIRYLDKGTPVIISGLLLPDRYKDKNGNAVNSLKLQVHSIYRTDTPSGEGNIKISVDMSESGDDMPDFSNDDDPFK